MIVYFSNASLYRSSKPVGPYLTHTVQIRLTKPKNLKTTHSLFSIFINNNVGGKGVLVVAKQNQETAKKNDHAV